jgi:autotransporter passenger strand-loop-strand repeat protein
LTVAVTGLTLGSGGSEFVESGGTARGTTVSSGATDYELAGGTASAAQLAGGQQLVYGLARGETINGGAQDVEAGGSASATTLSGGVQDVVAGGFATGTIVRGTGYAYVAAGGTASGTTLSAGTFEVASGGSTGSGAVTFSGGGILRLDDSMHFGGLVAGFGLPDYMDLADIPFVASGGSGATTATWTQLLSGGTGSGTLVVTGGGHRATLTLLGQYSQANFHVLNDGVNATLVSDPLVAAVADPVPVVTDPGPFVLVTPH